MAIVQLPNGQYANVADDITPEALNSIRQQSVAASTTRAQRVAAGQPRVAPTQNVTSTRADQLERAGMGRSAADVATNAATFGLADKVGAGLLAVTKGVYRAVRDHDVSQIGKTYTEQRDLDEELQRRYDDAHPGRSAAADITGALVNPVGTGAGGVAAAGRLAGKVGLTRAAGALTKGAARMEGAAPLAQAVMAGGTQGALNAAGHADSISDVPGALAEGAGIGAVTGGILGAGTHAAGRAVQILRDASNKNAERTAFMRVAQLLENGGTNARKVAREIAVTDARGGDAIVGDMTPGLRAQAGAISRKPNVPSSNELIERGDQRIAERRASFGDAVRDAAKTPAGGTDALVRADQIQSTRAAAGQADYAKGGAMDTPITPTPELQAYLNNAPAEVHGALKNAYNEMLLRDENPANYVGQNGIFTHIPNLRTFDYVKRGFNTQIGQALRSGDKATAQGLSYQLDKLKGVLADANPNDAAYQHILKTQRDAFQQQNALETGQSVLSRMGSKPREVLRELKALPDHAVDDARVGIIDALINSDNKADPVAAFRTIMRNDNQRKVMEFAFGGKGNLGRFERWVGREVRATRSDVLTAPGRQSETARFMMADSEGDTGPSTVLSNAMRGYAFGGTIGAGSAVMRTLQNIATGTTKVGQEEIAKILLSKGDNLVKGIDAAQAFQKGRKAGNRARALAAGKTGQQLYTDAAGGTS